MIVSFQKRKSKNLLYVLGTVISFAAVAWLYHEQDSLGDNFALMYSITFAAIPLLPIVTLLQIVRFYQTKKSDLTKPFVFLVIGLFSAFMAEQVWSVYSFVLDEDPFPSIADAFYLGMYPFVSIFLVHFIRHFKNSISKKTVFFSLTMSCALLIPTLTAASDFNQEEPTLGYWVAMSYPIFDAVVFAFLILTVINQFKTYRDNFLILFLFGLSIWIIADTAYLYGEMDGSYHEGNLVDLGYIASYLVWGISPLLIDKRNTQNLQQSTTIKFDAIRNFAIPFSLSAIYGITIFMMHHIGLFGDQTAQRTDTLNINLLFFGMSVIFTILVVTIYWNLNKLVKLKEQEITEKNQEIMRIEKLSTIGQLAANIAHDTRNPLAVIKNTMELLELRYGSKMDDVAKEEISWAHEAIDRISFNIENVLDYVRNTPLKIDCVVIEDLIETAIKSLSHSLKKVNVELPKSRTQASVDLDKIQTVFINILANASQAIEGKGNITIKVEDGNDSIQITIQDSGKGIPDDALPKIFDPLFTTKTRGTGLGLVSCKSIVDQHGGTISVKNNPTTFTIILPKNFKSKTEPVENRILRESLLKI